MSMSIADLTIEIKNIIGGGISKGRVMPAYWIVAAVLRNHPVIYDAETIGSKKCDSAYAELSRHELARSHVRRVLRLFKNPESDLPKFPGFDRLLKAYSLPGDSDDEDDAIIIPIQKMTDEQLLARAAEYRAMGDGCYEHAEEIERYVSTRRRAA